VSAFHRFGHQRRRSGRYRASLSFEADVADLVIVQLQAHRETVAAQGIEPLDTGIGRLQTAEITRSTVMVENHIPVQISEFHGLS